MSDRKPAFLVNDILQSIEKIALYTTGHSYESFSVNFMLMEACLYNMQVIGEAVSKLPDSIKISAPEIPWNLMKGMRNRLIHHYFGTDTSIVWNVAAIELPALKLSLQQLHQKLQQEAEENL